MKIQPNENKTNPDNERDHDRIYEESCDEDVYI